MVRPPPWNTGSPEISQMIKGWIEDCICHHSKYCAIHRARTSRLPARLLHIQNSGGTFHVNLCLPSEIGLYAYATLSHVWGSGSPIKLLRNNVLEFKQGIPFMRLPPTFADALQLTAALGLSYLWIDSLCIIQDDLLDWEAESTAMSDIYRGSIINIAASASVDCKGGLFRQRNLLSVTPCTIQMEDCNYALACGNIRTGPVAREPLSRRAWAVQERLLAPRTVQFTANSVYLECHSGTVSDIDAFNHYKIRKGISNEVSDWAADGVLAGSHGRPNRELCSRRWQKVVKIYTEAQLTHESDKLIAIAGLARFFQDLWPNPTTTYLAGLWSFNLGYWLLWRKTSSTRDWRKPKTSCAPSWSWASVKGSIEWLEQRSWACFRNAYIIEAKTVPRYDPFSSVQSGYIRIRGRMCTTKGNKKFAEFLTHNDLWLDDGDQGANRMEDVEGLFLLLAVRCEAYSTIQLAEALVLEYAGDQIGQYQRVGYFSVRGKKASQELQGFFFEPPRLAKHLLLDFSEDNDEPPRLAKNLYLDVSEDNEYTIDII